MSAFLTSEITQTLTLVQSRIKIEVHIYLSFFEGKTNPHLLNINESNKSKPKSPAN